MGCDRYFAWQLNIMDSLSIAEIALQGLSDVLFSIDADEGVAEVTLEAGASAIDTDVLGIDFVILLVFLLRLFRRAGDVIWIFVRELTRVSDRAILRDRLLWCLRQSRRNLTMLRLVRLDAALRVRTVFVSILVRPSLVLLTFILIIVLNVLLFRWLVLIGFLLLIQLFLGWLLGLVRARSVFLLFLTSLSCLTLRTTLVWPYLILL